MTKYGMSYVWFNPNVDTLHLYSTENDILQGMRSLIEKEYNIKHIRHNTGNFYQLELKTKILDTSYTLKVIEHMLFSYLCNNGWEPFARNHIGIENLIVYDVYMSSFRKKFED